MEDYIFGEKFEKLMDKLTAWTLVLTVIYMAWQVVRWLV